MTDAVPYHITRCTYGSVVDVYLFDQHPFITRAPKKSVIAALVDECMPAIDEYRENEAKDIDEQQSNSSGSDASAPVRPRLCVCDIFLLPVVTLSFLFFSFSFSSQEAKNNLTAHHSSGTMLSAAGAHTMVYSQDGTMVNNRGVAPHPASGDDDEFGTMVVTDASAKKAPQSSHTPSYMNHFREEEKRSQYPTMKSKNDPNSSDFIHFFKTGKVLFFLSVSVSFVLMWKKIGSY